MKQKFNICILSQSSTGIYPVFDEVAMMLYYGLKALGADVVMYDDCFKKDRINIVFGAHEYNSKRHPSFDGVKVILFNLEQLGVVEKNFNHEKFQIYYSLLKQHVVIDYCQNNIELLEKKNITAYLLNISYAPEMKRIFSSENNLLYDVTFIGAISTASPSRLLKYSPVSSPPPSPLARST